MKRKLLVLLLSFLVLNSYSQIDFVEKVVIGNENATHNPSSVFGADLDGDGDIDMISSSIFDGKIAWYENLDSQGGYGNQQVISLEATNANDVFAIDIDGDGDIDVVSGSGSMNEGKLAWYENLDGLGNFGGQIIIAEEPMAYRSIFSADIDGDGDNDIVASYTNPSGGKIVWYENLDGLGAYGSENIINGNTITVIAIFAADIDGDGDVDVLSGGGTNSPMGWYENLNAQGQFGPIKSISNGNIDRAVYAVDIDGDSHLDVLSAGGNQVRWYRNIDGLGNFGSSQTILNNNLNLNTTYPADIDGDGDIDIISGFSSQLNAVLFWSENLNGLGNFGSAEEVNYDSLSITSLFSADVDADGDSDILFASEDRIGYHENMDGGGNFGPQNFFTYNVDSPRYIDLVDIDNDGFMDVLSASYLDGEIAWYKKNGVNGNFGLQRRISNKKSFGARCVQGRDMDGDGDIDVLYSTDAMIAWHENLDGTGNFGIRNIIYEDITGPSIQEINAADMDGDGDLDIVYASTMTFELIWQENIDGNGTFGPRNIVYYAFGFSPISIDLADIDNDGKIDILSSSIGTIGEEGATWIKNLGNGSFRPQEQITLSSYFIEGADIDSDGDMDVVITNRDENKIVWYENVDGQGTFSVEKEIASDWFSPLSAYSADIDNDGDLDVVSASYYDQKIAWFENLDGLGNFGPQNILKDDTDRPYFVYADDADADGDNDIFAVIEGTNEIIWFKNSLILSLEQQSFFDFSIYPNPSSDFLNIVSQKQLQSVKVYNSLGQLILTNQISRDANIPTIEVKGLKAGLYFIKITTINGESGLQRFLKE